MLAEAFRPLSATTTTRPGESGPKRTPARSIAGTRVETSGTLPGNSA